MFAFGTVAVRKHCKIRNVRPVSVEQQVRTSYFASIARLLDFWLGKLGPIGRLHLAQSRTSRSHYYITKSPGLGSEKPVLSDRNFALTFPTDLMRRDAVVTGTSKCVMSFAGEFPSAHAAVCN